MYIYIYEKGGAGRRDRTSAKRINSYINISEYFVFLVYIHEEVGVERREKKAAKRINMLSNILIY